MHWTEAQKQGHLTPGLEQLEWLYDHMAFESAIYGEEKGSIQS